MRFALSTFFPPFSLFLFRLTVMVLHDFYSPMDFFSFLGSDILVFVALWQIDIHTSYLAQKDSQPVYLFMHLPTYQSMNFDTFILLPTMARSKRFRVVTAFTHSRPLNA